MGEENVYIYTLSYSYKSHEECCFFLKKSALLQMWFIDFIQQFNKQVNIKRLTFQTLYCLFLLFRQQKRITNTARALFWRGFVPESINR